MDRMRELTVGAGVGLSCCGDEGEEEGRRERGRMRDGGRRKERMRINEEKGKSVSEVRVGDLERGERQPVRTLGLPDVRSDQVKLRSPSQCREIVRDIQPNPCISMESLYPTIPRCISVTRAIAHTTLDHIRLRTLRSRKPYPPPLLLPSFSGNMSLPLIAR